MFSTLPPTDQHKSGNVLRATRYSGITFVIIIVIWIVSRFDGNLMYKHFVIGWIMGQYVIALFYISRFVQPVSITPVQKTFWLIVGVYIVVVAEFFLDSYFGMGFISSVTLILLLWFLVERKYRTSAKREVL